LNLPFQDHLGDLWACEITDDLGQAEHAHRNNRDSDPVAQLGNAEVEAQLARTDVGTDNPHKQSCGHHCE